MKIKINKNSIFRMIIVLFSIFVTIFMLKNTEEFSLYKNYYVIPMIYGICMMLSFKIDFFDIKFPGALLLIYTSIVKYLIMPFVMCLGNYYSWLGTMPSVKDIDIGIILTILEMVSLVFFTNYICYKDKNDDRKENIVKPLNSSLLHLILLVLGVITFFGVPSAFEDYRFILNTDNLGTTIKVDFAFSGIFKTIFILARYSFVILVINYFYKKNIKKKSLFNVIMSFVPVIMICMYISNLSRINIFVPLLTFSILIYLMFNDKKERKFIVKILLITILLSTTFMSALKFFGKGRGNEGKANDVAWWGDTLNMYFSGPKETAIGVKAKTLINDVYGWKKYNLLINDVFSNIIGLSNFTYNKNSTALYNFIYFSSDVAVCQIVPNIIEGYYYFGSLLCFIWPCLFIYLCYFFNKKARQSKTADLKFAYLYSSIYCGMVLMINATMLIGNIINVTLLYVIFSKINEKIVARRK